MASRSRILRVSPPTVSTWLSSSSTAMMRPWMSVPVMNSGHIQGFDLLPESQQAGDVGGGDFPGVEHIKRLSHDRRIALAELLGRRLGLNDRLRRGWSRQGLSDRFGDSS